MFKGLQQCARDLPGEREHENKKKQKSRERSMDFHNVYPWLGPYLYLLLLSFYIFSL